MTRKSTRNYTMKLATTAIRGAVALAVFLALVLIATQPAPAQNQAVLYNFTGGSDGGSPGSSLTSDAAGNFYGTTQGGGAWGAGTVFELSPNGSGGWNEAVLYSFTGGADGANPDRSDLIFDGVGNLYGTTYSGGANGYGVVFELSPEGAGWTEIVLHSFAGGADGANPVSGVIMSPTGNLYGTTGETVFELSPSAGGWTEQVIYAASNSYGLTMDAAGNIFGPAISVTGNSSVFELSPDGSGGWTPTVIYDLPCTRKGCPIGVYPNSALVLDKAGNLYGTGLLGGAKDYGTVYKLSPVNGKWTGVVLHSFKGGPEDGSYPCGIVIDSDGNIFGATQGGGDNGDGTVFELVAPVGNGHYPEKVLWSFNQTDGFSPFASPILGNADRLYSTAMAGGAGSNGVVFEVTQVKTTTTLASSADPSIYAQPVTFTAVVTSSAGTPRDGDTVTFERITAYPRNPEILGTGVLKGGSASFTTSTLKLGVIPVNAFYGGDPDFLGSESNTVWQEVDKDPTTTTLSSSLNPSIYGQPVTLTATVTSAGPAPTSKVQFKNGSKGFAVAKLNAAGVATVTTAAIPAGVNTLTATYLTDTYNKSSWAEFTQTVNQASISMVLTSTPNPSTFGKLVKFRATLTSNGGVPSGQSVTFSCSGATLGTAIVGEKGLAAFSTKALPQGADTVTATYAGSTDFSPASATVIQVVN